MDRVRHLPLAALVATLLCCGPDAGAVDYVRHTREPVGDTTSPDAGPEDGGPTGDTLDRPDWDARGAGPLTGTFAANITIEANVVAPVTSHQLARIRLLQRGTTVRQRVTLCKFLLPSVEGVAELSIPSRLESVIRRKPIDTRGEFLSRPDPTGARFDPATEPLVVGAALDDPAGDPLPSTPDASSIVDEDNDDRPGVTIAAEAATCEDEEELHAALRTITRFAGTVQSLDRIQGTLDPTLDQSILGISADCLSIAKNLEIEIVDGSSFTARRLTPSHDTSGDGIHTCAEIEAAAGELFGKPWNETSSGE